MKRWLALGCLVFGLLGGEADAQPPAAGTPYTGGETFDCTQPALFTNPLSLPGRSQ
jgi:hypothetical protein